jgi:hypothetical protein
MKYRGTVTEQLTIEKTVEITIPDDTPEDEIRSLLEEEAYKVRLEETGGWGFSDIDPYIDVDNVEKVG